MVQWCRENDQEVAKICFQNIQNAYRYSEAQNGETKSQINYITINRIYRNAVLQYKTYPSNECRCDFLRFICNLRIQLWKLMKDKTTIKLNSTESWITRIKMSCILRAPENILKNNLNENGNTNWSTFRDIRKQYDPDKYLDKEKRNISQKKISTWETEKQYQGMLQNSVH